MAGDPEASRPIGPRLALLRRLGFGDLIHDSHVPFLSHLLGTRRLLAKWGERGAMCDAGLFHSAYGTQFFQPDQPASRSAVRQLIGDEGEEIAWVWCTILRDTIEVMPPHTVSDRRTGELVTLSAEMVADIATLWAADTVEQIARMASDERAFAHGLGRILHLARPAAITASASTTQVTS